MEITLDALLQSRDNRHALQQQLLQQHPDGTLVCLTVVMATGYEAYLITDLPALDAKRVTCDIEDSHPLGRLFDIDVMDADGAPISRQTVGGEPRRCLLCDHEARWCMRNHSHTQEELMNHIQQLIEDYVR